jgi:hypothetical protein
MVFYLTADALIAYHRNLANSPSTIEYGAFGFPEPEKFQTTVVESRYLLKFF